MMNTAGDYISINNTNRQRKKNDNIMCERYYGETTAKRKTIDSLYVTPFKRIRRYVHPT
jgi:hypothetical protein